MSSAFMWPVPAPAVGPRRVNAGLNQSLGLVLTKSPFCPYPFSQPHWVRGLARASPAADLLSNAPVSRWLWLGTDCSALQSKSGHAQASAEPRVLSVSTLPCREGRTLSKHRNHAPGGGADCEERDTQGSRQGGKKEHVGGGSENRSVAKRALGTEAQIPSD